MANDPYVSVVTVNPGPVAAITVSQSSPSSATIIGGIGAQGPQGIQGTTGSQGIQGIQGVTGATGPVGNYVISVNGLTGTITNLAALSGAAFTTDIIVNGMNVGLGGSNIESNVAIGASALENVQYDYDGEYGGSNNVAIGDRTLVSNQWGGFNVALGSNSLRNTTVSSNVGIGANTLYNNVNGSDNVAIGSGPVSPLLNNISSSYNVAIGSGTLYGITSGADYNVGIGINAFINLKKGSNNVSIGRSAGTEAPNMSIGNQLLRAVDESVYIGYNSAGFSASGVTSEIVIGARAIGLGTNTTVIGSPTQISATIYGILNVPKGVSANNILRLTSTPASITSTGITGQVALTNTDMYICTATNTWRKVALTTF